MTRPDPSSAIPADPIFDKIFVKIFVKIFATLGLLLLGACGADPSASAGPRALDLASAKSDAQRTVALVLPAGQTKRYRVRATGFFARLSQVTAVPAQLSAKHYAIELEGETSVAPELTATADGTLRHWTLRVVNRGASALVGTVSVTALQAPMPLGILPLGIISDIDKTLLPPHDEGEPLPPPYPGVAELLRRLEGEPDGLYFVTARTPERVEGLGQWFADHNIPADLEARPIETGTSGMPWVARPEKVRDISKIFDANPTQRFVLLGDSSHVDPEVHREIIAKYGSRVVASLIHRVTETSPDRVVGLHLVDHYAEAAAVLYGLGVFDEPTARAVGKAAQAEGLVLPEGGPLTDEAIEQLLADHAPGVTYHGNLGLADVPPAGLPPLRLPDVLGRVRGTRGGARRRLPPVRHLPAVSAGNSSEEGRTKNASPVVRMGHELAPGGAAGHYAPGERSPSE